MPISTDVDPDGLAEPVELRGNQVGRGCGAARTPWVFCLIRAVTAVVAYGLRAENLSRSAQIPAPPQGPGLAMARMLGTCPAVLAAVTPAAPDWSGHRLGAGPGHRCRQLTAACPSLASEAGSPRQALRRPRVQRRWPRRWRRPAAGPRPGQRAHGELVGGVADQHQAAAPTLQADMPADKVSVTPTSSTTTSTSCPRERCFTAAGATRPGCSSSRWTRSAKCPPAVPEPMPPADPLRVDAENAGNFGEELRRCVGQTDRPFPTPNGSDGLR